ncbi:hypothetical protein AUK40_06805 [Candidatus Wirthbacteria bacterium CG2_30_54_11]|uniref:GtrA/DPMS transmembrane domain-containing protein n=1 Tax=Candidatus Wirthbacteria bacterium CG2_30_54_11 TaxID=1817892 RepID=A0A1J5ICX6_9BACT|nr:MAG: hypothetical protein AUK40_06805 [Candidatus Wirthbacteria bacterium CG2_30_54_11]
MCVKIPEIKTIIRSQFFRFLIVGGLNTLFSYALYAFLIWLRLGFFLASTVSTVIGIAFNFKTTGTLVFKNKDNRLIVKFFGVYVVTYCINVSGLWVLTRLGVNEYLAGLVMVLPVAMLSFVLMRTFVFPKSAAIDENRYHS